MNFDVIGRRELVSRTLHLPHVLKCIVDEYVGIEIVPRYCVGNAKEEYFILGIVGNHVFSSTMQHEIPNLSDVRQVNDSLALFAVHTRFQIRDVRTNKIVFETSGSSTVVHNQTVYYANHLKRLMRYDATTNHVTAMDDPLEVYELRKCHNTITVFYAQTYRVLDERVCYYTGDLFAIMDYENKRYRLNRTSAMCTGLPTIAIPEYVDDAVGVDGFIVLRCLAEARYVLDLKRWKLIPVGYFFMYHGLVFYFNVDEKLIEVYS